MGIINKILFSKTSGGSLSGYSSLYKKLHEALIDNPGPTPDEEPEERLEGDGAEFYTLAPTALSFRSTAPLNELQEIQINGVTVDPANYTLEEGSTIVTFPIDYLKTLEVGNYEVAVASNSKTVRGGFIVKAPELNEYGFYYNQPYVGYLSAYNGNFAFFVQEGGNLNLISLDEESDAIPCTYTIEGSNTTVTSPMGVFTGMIADNGFYINEFATTFVLGSIEAVADDNYIYRYDPEIAGYTLSSFKYYDVILPKPKDNVNGYKTVKIGRLCFRNHNIVRIPELPDSVQIIGDEAFRVCSYLTTIIIPNGITTIGKYAFYATTSVKKIVIPSSVTYIDDYAFSCSGSEVEEVIYEGTVAQWNAITFGTDVFDFADGSVEYVQCSDGQVAL